MLKQKLTSAQVVERRQATERIRHSTEMEGGRSSDEVREIQDRWVRGEITIEEMGLLTRALYNL